MCGFVGIASPLDLKHYIKDIKTALTKFAYRGPDQSNILHLGDTLIGFNRLSINYLTAGLQPHRFQLNDKSEKDWICFNGEIFNHKYLEQSYLSKPWDRDEIKVLADLYVIFGNEMFKLLNGQFSIAIYLSESNEMVLCRDPYGIRPLFYAQNNKNAFIFASDLKSLWSLSVEKNICQQQLQRLHLTWATSPEATIWRNVYQIRPGCFSIIQIDNNFAIDEYCYWDWSEVIANQCLVSRRMSITDVEEFSHQLSSAVNRQSMSDVGVGCYISGGIDSSAIACELSSFSSPINSYSVSFSDAQYDESSKQRKMSAMLKSNHTQIKVQDEDIGKYFPVAVDLVQQPFFRSAPVPLYLLAAQVRMQRERVVLTGEGADELLYGYDIFRERACIDFIKKKPQSSWRYSVFDNLYSYLPQFKNKRLRKLAIDSLMREGEFSVLNALQSRLLNNSRMLALMNGCNVGQVINSLVDEYESKRSFHALDSLSKIQYFEIENLLCGYLLSSQGDRMTMGNSVESRYPFLDLEFTNYVFTLPRDWKIRGNNFKRILRCAYSGKVPTSIVNAPKVAYQAPEARAILSNQTTKEMMLDSSNPVYQFYNYNKMKKIINRVGSDSLPNSRGSFSDNALTCIVAGLSYLLSSK